ncbi:MAG: hypothetical protein K9L23_21925 [Desulfotignum sp.]|nr:hypothetical protein [Desulfotignum sp.]MCF8090705.1 hypothetical protein [Desulfotignum sp.]
MVELSRHLIQEKREYVLSNQVLRSGTSKADIETLLKLLVSIIKSSKKKSPQ